MCVWECACVCVYACVCVSCCNTDWCLKSWLLYGYYPQPVFFFYFEAVSHKTPWDSTDFLLCWDRFELVCPYSCIILHSPGLSIYLYDAISICLPIFLHNTTFTRSAHILVRYFIYKNCRFIPMTCDCHRRKAAFSFPADQPGNNHKETVLIKSLLSPLALASYWLTLTS